MKKLLPIEELWKACQPEGPPRCSLKRLHRRRVAIYITWLFLLTPISATEVSWLGGLLSIGGAILFIFGHPWLTLIGVLVILGSSILDYVDGQIARYRGAAGPEGGLMDAINHYMLWTILFMCLTFGVYQHFPETIVIILGCIATISFVSSNMLADIREAVLLEMFSGQEKVPGSVSENYQGHGFWGYLANLYARPPHVVGMVTTNLFRHLSPLRLIGIASIIDIILGWVSPDTLTTFSALYVALATSAILICLDYIAKLIYIVQTRQIQSDYAMLSRIIKKAKPEQD